MTLKCPGTYSSTSLRSSPSIRTAPPQAGQALAAGCTFVSRGRFAGNGRRAGLALAPGAAAGAELPAGASAGIGGASAAPVSISSMASSSWAALRSSFSDERPNCIRRSFISCSFSFSSSSVLSFSAAKARSRSARCSTTSRFRLGTSSGRSAVCSITSACCSDSAGRRHSHRLSHAVAPARRTHPASSGAKVRAGWRQSMPSSSIDNCAGVNAATPWSVRGHTNRPFSSRLA